MIKILDCTLRDGGYYNNWDFDLSLVNKYLASTSQSLIDIIEIGFRSPQTNKKFGAFYYSSDKTIRSLELSEKQTYCVMVNAKSFYGSSSLIKDLFSPRNESPLSLVRIAINFNNVTESFDIANALKSLGYDVALNLMQSHGKSDKDYFDTIDRIKKENIIDVIYFADSLGNMHPDNVSSISNIIRDVWKKDIGIHTHNNKNLALINSLSAIDNGVTYIDSTITGMGRGAGNVPTENLLLESKRLGVHLGDAKYLLPTIDDFNILKNKYKWGSSFYYHFAANHDIHPTYVQSITSDERYSQNEILSALHSLSRINSTNFSTDVLRETIYTKKVTKEGSWVATDWLKKKDVLIVGAGPSVQKYKKSILKYIKIKKPTVFFLNINNILPHSIADVVVVAHATRALFDRVNYSEFKNLFILPKSRIGSLVENKIDDDRILDYGLIIKQNYFKIKKNHCYLEWPLAAPYALAIATEACAKSISLVGFDGYPNNDKRHKEMEKVFDKYSNIENKKPVISLTPTIYNIDEKILS